MSNKTRYNADKIAERAKQALQFVKATMPKIEQNPKYQDPENFALGPKNVNHKKQQIQ